MKKIVRIILLLVIFVNVILLTSCKEANYQNLGGKTFAEVKQDNPDLIGVLRIRDVANVLYNAPSGKMYILYQSTFSSVLEDGEYELITSSDGKYPSIKLKGLYFSGVYEISDGEYKRINDVNSQEIVLVRFISYSDAALMSLLCILIVFSILIIICLIVSLFKFKKTKQPAVVPQEVKKQRISLEDIKDPDMQVAAIVASIDYHTQIKKDVRIVSIREIK